MKKANQKLQLRSETLRALARTDLPRVAGGLESAAGRCQYLANGDTKDHACAEANATAFCD